MATYTCAGSGMRRRDHNLGQWRLALDPSGCVDRGTRGDDAGLYAGAAGPTHPIDRVIFATRGLRLRCCPAGAGRAGVHRKPDHSGHQRVHNAHR
ncbi:hypothetical protein RLO149_c026470 [Roseobacter litoralis Och 149]|uniref:Uncharacterized protein n=1 Tax=Roseobacter litoralis (strain ATCC 49566 / DSM 6996 / JCM 21268 / NBRC 15278 / OCh 149) TaxID=391595 RepID=F7ZE97_ROSLO|nr:hypothetical protein RLO149_c026470 [Roseobacter litoralis Och 149]